jgi:hypothetical protein
VQNLSLVILRADDGFYRRSLVDPYFHSHIIVHVSTRMPNDWIKVISRLLVVELDYLPDSEVLAFSRVYTP